MQTDPFKKRPAVLAQLPRIVRLYIYHCIFGFVISAGFTTVVLATNLANIGHLVFTVQGGWLAGFVFFVLNGIVFSGVQTGIVIMSIGDDDDDEGGGHKRAVRMEAQLAPVPLHAGTGRGNSA